MYTTEIAETGLAGVCFFTFALAVASAVFIRLDGKTVSAPGCRFAKRSTTQSAVTRSLWTKSSR